MYMFNMYFTTRLISDPIAVGKLLITDNVL
jgi:hypothetical protein